jgi:ethanolamine utilization protein EutN
MLVARVMGTVVASRKDEGLFSTKLLLVQPIGADGSDLGKPLVATDSVGCGFGERVFFVRGREAALPFLPAEVPTDAAIVGIVDDMFVP